MPKLVWEELAAGDDADPEYLPQLLRLRAGSTLTPVSVAQSSLFVEVARELDTGETAAITTPSKPTPILSA